MIGDRLSHYRLIEKIGAGGMGVVYRAHDEQLERDVAIKILSSGTLADEGARKRFRKEALALAKLNHPNVAMVFEFGTAGDLDFLVTEYIPGVTLDAKISHNPLPLKEVVDLGTQLAHGLAAAHQQGIVHRDLKPGNLRLTPDGRLKILDFGLAELTPRPSDLGKTITVTQSTDVTGTVPYMAPEQLRAEAVDFRSDIWSAGVVLYEMATGNRPFAQQNGPLLMAAILTENPAPPSQADPKFPPHLENIILKSLDKDPRRRYQSATELSVDLERVASASGSVASISGPSEVAQLEKDVVTPRGRKMLGVGALLAAAIAAILAFYFLHSRTSKQVSEPATARRSVAVLGFKNRSGQADQQWLSSALAEMLTTELSAGDKLRIIPGENVARMTADHPLPDTDTLSNQTLSAIFKNLGSNLVVQGSVVDFKGQVRVDLTVQDTASGNTVARIADSEGDAQFLDLVKRLGATLRQKCGAGEITAEETAAMQAAEPSTADAARLYAEGLTNLRAFDFLAARDLLVRAVSADPNNVLAYSALAAAWAQLGYDDKAAGQAKRAFELSKRLSTRDRVSIEAEYRESIRDWDKTVDLYKSLWTFFPDDLEYGLRLSAAQISAGSGQEALVTIESLRKLPHPVSDDPRIDLAEARAADSLSDYKRAETLAVRAEDNAKQRGRRFLEAQALLQQCWALRNLGELERAKAIGEQAGKTLADAGDFRGEAKSLTCVANVLADQGQVAEARSKHEKALALARQIGAEGDIAGALLNIGVLLATQQELDASNAQNNEALALANRIGDKYDALIAENNLAANLISQGDFPGARKILETSVETARQTGDKSSIADVLTNLGTISYLQGDLAAARRDLETSLAASRELGTKSRIASSLVSIGEVLLAQDDLVGAERDFNESLSIRTQLGEKGNIAGSQISLAMLALERNQAEKAETLAKAAAAEFQAETDADQETSARDVLAQSFLAQAKFAAAQSEIARAQALPIRDQASKLSFDVTCARVLGRTGQPGQALRNLQATLSTAKRMKLKGIEFSARWAQAEAWASGGDPVSSRAGLESLRKDAASAGFLLMARKASKK
jgi:serine/threonine protein kinase/tetratricopeptide (TPR) repeat protein